MISKTGMVASSPRWTAIETCRPSSAEAFEVARHIVAADHVEHDLDTLAAGDRAHALDKVLAPIVDRMIGAEPHRRFALGVGSRGHDDRQPEQLGERDRHRADAAGAAMDQHRVAIAGIGALEQIGPHGEQRLGHRRRLGHAQRLGHRQALAGGRYRIFA
jgi:hypothetical protein